MINRIATLFLLLFLTVHSSAQIPEPPAIKNGSYSFCVVADRFGGEHKGIYSQIIKNVNEKKPDMILCVGDLVNGHTKNEKEAKKQWTEFDKLMSSVSVPFFPTPGNHDVCASASLSEWINRYEVLYYSFEAGEDLFCVLSTDCLKKRGIISKRESDYFVNAIKNYDGKRVFLFMHTPVWKNSEETGFEPIISALEDKEYYIFSGHEHCYFFEDRGEDKCFVMGTSGGDVDESLPGEIFHYFYVTVSGDNVSIESRGVNDQLLPL